MPPMPTSVAFASKQSVERASHIALAVNPCQVADESKYRSDWF